MTIEIQIVLSDRQTTRDHKKLFVNTMNQMSFLLLLLLCLFLLLSWSLKGQPYHVFTCVHFKMLTGEIYFNIYVGEIVWNISIPEE